MKRILIVLMVLMALIITACEDKNTEPKISTLRAPVIYPESGTFTTPQSITIIANPDSAEIRYTTDGSDPIATSSLYTEPIVIYQNTTIKAKAFLSGFNSSPITTSILTVNLLKVPAPVFTLEEAVYNVPQTVSILCAITDATIRYTTDGSEPNNTSTIYTIPLNITSTTSLKARAFKANAQDSDITSAVYVIRPVLPGDMVLVNSGTFQMGSTTGDTDEQPVHNVTLSNFYIGKYEVTQREWLEIMGTNPSQFLGDDLRPVDLVKWYDAVKFCNKKSIQEGLTPCYSKDNSTNPDNWTGNPETDESWANITCDWTANGYRLPTEAEWEFASKGGNSTQHFTYSGSNNIGEVAWYSSNSNGRSQSIGRKSPNELGIFDMTGNLFEWCWDFYNDYSATNQNNPTGPVSGTYRVVRGASWNVNHEISHVTFRSGKTPILSQNSVGFRLVRNAN